MSVIADFVLQSFVILHTRRNSFTEAPSV